jgi:hypothetical protein
MMPVRQDHKLRGSIGRELDLQRLRQTPKWFHNSKFSKHTKRKRVWKIEKLSRKKNRI